MTKIKLELITDKYIYLKVEQGIRGGVAVIPTRYAESVPNVCSLLYLDYNEIYASAMQRYLPTSGFEFVSVDISQVLSTADDSNICYICEVDVMIPDDLHTYIQDFPLASCKSKVGEEQLSPFQK